MRINNIFLAIIAITGVYTVSSCTKVLDVAPAQSILAADALQNDEDVNKMVLGTYSLAAGGALYGTNLFLIPDLLASESYCSWRGTFQGFRQASGKTMTRDNSEANRIWTSGYRVINNANIVLENLDKVKNAALKTQLEGEALFFRGLMHFELVRLYALPWNATPGNTHTGVVIRTKATNNEAQAFERIPRATVNDVYAAVISDLTAAASKLGNDNGVRADKFTVLAFLSRVYLQKGDYAAARAAANDVIASGKYRIGAEVLGAFNAKNNAEAIWEIQQNEQNNAGTSNDGMATFYASLPGIGRGDVRMVSAFTNTYPAGDFRRRDWFYVGTGARPGNTYCAKWSSFSQNLPVIRITEMYLTRAECNIRLGGAALGATPAEDLAAVRNPIRTNSTAAAVPVLDDVLNERFLELAFEGLRIHDLRRLQRSTGSFTWNANRLVIPIPAREVDASGGVIAQNPGY